VWLNLKMADLSFASENRINQLREVFRVFSYLKAKLSNLDDLYECWNSFLTLFDLYLRDKDQTQVIKSDQLKTIVTYNLQ
jgi:hypothetical protein